MKSWIQLAQQQSKIFELAIPLTIGETYTVSMNSNEPFIISVGDVFVGETVDGSLEFVATNTGDVMITSYSDISMEFEIKLELGSQTEWSPAPEDGYGLDLPNGAYHIQGGNSFAKTVEEGVHVGVNTYAWSNITLNGTELPINDNERYREDSNKLEFSGTNLDFIAVDPFIGLSSSVEELYENNMRSLSIKDKMKPINILNLTREDAHDNYPYPLNWETIPVNERSEIVIADNQIMDKRRDEYAPSLFNAIEGLSYTPFDSETYGVLYLEPLDTIEVIDMNEVSHVSLVTSNRLKFTSGIKETLTSELPSKLKDKYALVTDNERQSMRVYFLVDKQNGIIQGLVEELGEVKDQTAQLTIKVDEIELNVANTSNGNVIGNFNPQDYLGWEGGSRLLYVAEYSKLRYLSGLTYAMGFQPVRMAGSLSEWGLSFFNNGSATSPFGYVVPTEKYSYKAKVQRFKPFSIDLLEYKDMVTPFHKSTRFTFNNPQAYVQFTSELDSQTAFVRIKFNVTGVTPSDRLEITENMYNRGLPKEYFVSGTEALVYAQSNINILDNKIGLVVDEVKVVDNKTEINKASITIQGDEIKSTVQRVGQAESSITQNATAIALKANQISLDATNVEVSGKVSFTDLSTGGSTIINGANITTGKIKAEYLDFNNATGTNVNLTGTINAAGGKIAGFNISGNDLVGQDVSLAPNEITVGTSIIKNVSQDGRLGVKGKGLVVGFETTSSPSETSVIRWGSLSGLGIFFGVHNGSDTSLWAINDIIISNTTGQSKIGSTSSRLGNIYLQNQPNVASDTRYKNDIQDIDPFLLDMIAKYVIPKRYETQFDDKLHFGYIAQDVEMALYQYFYQSSVLNGMNKLEASRFANTQIAQFAFLSKSDSYMSLLYGEIAVIMDAYNRSRIDELEDRLTKLELML